MKIKDYIKELLFTNQGVVVPGLGGFVSEYEPAAFDVNENKFLPPSKKILFNPDYSYHDNLLTDFISKRENIDEENSEKLLEKFVGEIKSKLKKGEKIEFPEIGTLSQTNKGVILFEQNTESNLLSNSYGLKSVKTKQIIHQQSAIKTAKPVKQQKSYKKLILIGSSAIVFLFLIAASWYFTDRFTDFSILSFKNTEFQAAENSLKDITEKNLDSIADADSLKALIVNSIDDNTDIKDALFYEEPVKEDPKPKYSSFHIVAGSFRKMENAEKFSSELKNKGYNPEIIKSDEDLIRIAIFSYNNETEALKKLYRLRETSEIKSVWILKSI
ncbi:MAG: SPOR domain-containing protein [Bacteroidales bacterium]|nr:SPOR domain-containing protein [Bacteroidales bacterium]